MKGRENQNACLARIHSMFQLLTKTEQKDAEYIITNPSDVIHMTITELADTTGSAEATFPACARNSASMGSRASRSLWPATCMSPSNRFIMK